jgi:hypothetical protein
LNSKEKIILTPKYYLEYFTYLLQFVEKKYALILNEAEQNFLQQFNNLPENAQCLFVRMTNRNGLYFRQEKLVYTEIEHITEQWTELFKQNFAEKLSKNHLTDLADILKLFTKNELIHFLKTAKENLKGLSVLSKEELADMLVVNTTLHEQLYLFLEQNSLVKQGFEHEVMMLKFLFFGNRHDTMTEFVTRDLGFQKYETYDEDKMVAHFATRQEAEDRLKVSYFGERFYELAKERSATEHYYWALEWISKNQQSLTEPALLVLERYKLRFASFFEKQKEYEVAYDMYTLTDWPPSRERQTRLLLKLNYPTEARQLAELILATAYSNDEFIFAQDFINKLEAKASKTKSKKTVTLELQEAESIELDISWKNNVETGVIDYYQQRGYEALFSENTPWKSLFGLLFWDIIYDSDYSTIHHPLQRAPSDIYKPIFFESRRSKLLERIDQLKDSEAVVAILDETIAFKQGITNPLVDWHPLCLKAVKTIGEKLSPYQLEKIMLEIASNLHQNTHGFPDLLVWNNENLEFIEVKSPNDKLSSQQYFWQKYFKKIQIPTKVLRVTWRQ